MLRPKLDAVAGREEAQKAPSAEGRRQDRPKLCLRNFGANAAHSAMPKRLEQMGRTGLQDSRFVRLRFEDLALLRRMPQIRTLCTIVMGSKFISIV